MRNKRSDAACAIALPYTITIPLAPQVRQQLDSRCGPGLKLKRGVWIAEAIREKLAREDEVRS